MAQDQNFGSKNILRFLMYIALIALCVAAILYMLINAHPREAPKVKEGQPTSHLIGPSHDSALPQHG
jgi:hypothetical protein